MRLFNVQAAMQGITVFLVVIAYLVLAGSVAELIIQDVQTTRQDHRQPRG